MASLLMNLKLLYRVEGDNARQECRYSSMKYICCLLLVQAVMNFKEVRKYQKYEMPETIGLKRKV
jgi:hypothetical protein